MADQPVPNLNTPAIEAEIVVAKEIKPWYHIFFSDGTGLYPNMVLSAHLNGCSGMVRRPVNPELAYALSLGKKREDILDTWLGNTMKVECLQKIIEEEKKRNSSLTIEAAEYHSHQLVKRMATLAYNAEPVTQADPCVFAMVADSKYDPTEPLVD